MSKMLAKESVTARDKAFWESQVKKATEKIIERQVKIQGLLERQLDPLHGAYIKGIEQELTKEREASKQAQEPLREEIQ
jgi:hypothetical protein